MPRLSEPMLQPHRRAYLHPRSLQRPIVICEALTAHGNIRVYPPSICETAAQEPPSDNSLTDALRLASRLASLFRNARVVITKLPCSYSQMHGSAQMAMEGAHVRRDMFVLAMVVPAGTAISYLAYCKTPLFLAVLPFLVYAALSAADSLEQFFGGKTYMRATGDVLRIHRSLYEQLDRDVIQLLASNRDFDSNDYERLLQLDSFNVQRSQGASDDEIRRLPLVDVTEKMLQCAPSCSICLMDLEVDAQVRLLHCFHRFHPACIDLWLKEKAECPMCKFPAIG